MTENEESLVEHADRTMPEMMASARESLGSPIRCRHCGEPVRKVRDGWAHVRGPGSILYNCQHTVPYGQVAEPDVPSAHRAVIEAKRLCDESETRGTLWVGTPELRAILDAADVEVECCGACDDECDCESLASCLADWRSRAEHAEHRLSLLLDSDAAVRTLVAIEALIRREHAEPNDDGETFVTTRELLGVIFSTGAMKWNSPTNTRTSSNRIESSQDD